MSIYHVAQKCKGNSRILCENSVKMTELLLALKWGACYNKNAGRSSACVSMGRPPELVRTSQSVARREAFSGQSKGAFMDKSIPTSDIKTEIKLNDFIKAPVKKGEKLGTVTYEIDGQTYSSDLIANTEVVRIPYLLIAFKILIILSDDNLVAYIFTFSALYYSICVIQLTSKITRI